MSERLAERVLVVLIVLKVVITAWNAQAYHGHQYDTEHHIGRVSSGGLRMSPQAYNPALYYMPALLTKHLHTPASPGAPIEGAVLLKDLRNLNVAYLAAFYALWVFVLFPAILPQGNAWVASLFLLALPGYQKLAMMAHPDNLVPLTSAAALALWIRGRKRLPLSWPRLIALAASIGLIGLTRPFAAGSVAALTAWALLDELPGFCSRPFIALCRAGVFTALVGAISLSWYAYRYHETGHLGGYYNKKYIGHYEPHRKDFDFVHFFATFYPRQLLKRPNRSIYRLDQHNPRPRNRYTNSFWTLLYSEVWGDHLLYISGPTNEERKLWPKRIVLALALPTFPLLLIGLLRSAWAAVRAGARRVFARRDALAIASMFVLGAGLYLYWATGSGLLPGKGSTIKFIYMSHLFPLALALALLVPLGRRAQRALVAYALVLFVAALPIATFELGQSARPEPVPTKGAHVSCLDQPASNTRSRVL